jgi:hypothetical protein
MTLSVDTSSTESFHVSAPLAGVVAPADDFAGNTTASVRAAESLLTWTESFLEKLEVRTDAYRRTCFRLGVASVGFIATLLVEVFTVMEHVWVGPVAMGVMGVCTVVGWHSLTTAVWLLRFLENDRRCLPRLQEIFKRSEWKALEKDASILGEMNLRLRRDKIADWIQSRTGFNRSRRRLTVESVGRCSRHLRHERVTSKRVKIARRGARSALVLAKDGLVGFVEDLLHCQRIPHQTISNGLERKFMVGRRTRRSRSGRTR